MKLYRVLVILLVITLVLTACGSNGGSNGISELFATDTPIPLPTAHVNVTPAPDARAAVGA